MLIENVTTSTQTDHRQRPILYHLGRDPGEKFQISHWTNEYKEQIEILRKIVDRHQSNLVLDQPRLNWCDEAVMVNELSY